MGGKLSKTAKSSMIKVADAMPKLTSEQMIQEIRNCVPKDASGNWIRPGLQVANMDFIRALLDTFDRCESLIADLKIALKAAQDAWRAEHASVMTMQESLRAAQAELKAVKEVVAMETGSGSAEAEGGAGV